MKFTFFNDTCRIVSIHPATYSYGCIVEGSATIKPLEERIFILPDGSNPHVKLWDYGEGRVLQILVASPNN